MPKDLQHEVPNGPLTQFYPHDFWQTRAGTCLGLCPVLLTCCLRSLPGLFLTYWPRDAISKTSYISGHMYPTAVGAKPMSVSGTIACPMGTVYFKLREAESACR